MKQKNYVTVFEEIVLIVLLVCGLIVKNQATINSEKSQKIGSGEYLEQRKDTTSTYYRYLKQGRLKLYDEFYDFDHIPGEEVHQKWLEILETE